eukprot:3607962-Rhodomonas_salina.2
MSALSCLVQPGRVILDCADTSTYGGIAAIVGDFCAVWGGRGAHGAVSLRGRRRGQGFQRRGVLRYLPTHCPVLLLFAATPPACACAVQFAVLTAGMALCYHPT